MNFRSVAQLDHDVVQWIGTLPRDFDVIVGVPRSGLLVANLLALHLNLPVTDVEGLLAGRVFQNGSRFKRRKPDLLREGRCKVLVVDDSVLSGKQIRIVKEMLKTADLPHRIYFGAPYVTRESKEWVDFHCAIVPLPRCFEWNMLHQERIMSRSCLDIDGVLCRDPLPEQNDDGARYTDFLQCAEPLHLPSHPVGWLVTSRLEKYRAHTEAWLAANGVRFGELIMMQYPDMAARRAAKAYASFKADAYDKTGAWLFIESSPRVASRIAELTGKPVFCTESWEMLTPSALPRTRRAVRDLPTSLRRTLANGYRRLTRAPAALRRRLQALSEER